MQCKVCKTPTASSTGVCNECGSFSHSPVQSYKDTVNSSLVNILLGSFGILILGIILLSVAIEL